MMQEWKSRLFSSPNPLLGLNLSELPLSIAEGTRILGICYRTWKRWNELAMDVPEYKQQHMQMLSIVSNASAAPPILRYQVWVIGKIGEIYNQLPNGIPKKWIAQEYLRTKSDDFTQEQYQKEQLNFENKKYIESQYNKSQSNN
ncbi:MAG: hypothetical protein KME21_29130 [Desmonostoc vinosum HA7617-LM4]|jgi:hypothetical protein|nr:hypothetical protein [Desmonostoc vinosum HA7617-LM4]